MMVGITAWQQQVPLPQRYADGNAWLIPLRPEVSANPVSIKGRFLRGAIALAANGIPIFNPQNNRGEVSAEIGELDQWGGHCGRADDYHYHAAPFHLQSAVGQGRPIAYALDGYPIYGLTEPDGSTPEKLDAFHGHERMGLGYHYHGSTRYPYVNGGFHGVVVERDGQVDPQPRAQSPRRDQPPLRGAKITDFSTAPDEKVFSLGYTVNGKPASMSYQATGDGGWIFKFVGADGVAREESFPAGGARPGGGKGGNDRRPPPPPPSRDTDSGARVTAEVPPPHTGAMVLRSPVVGADHVLPVEFTGDGASATPPLEWSGVPAGTKALAVIMHHLDPEGMTKWYWTLYNIPADVTGLSKNTQGIGTLGNNSVNRRVGFAPPHSKGPGEKTYVLTVYALSAPLKIDTAPAETNRAGLLNAMRGLVLDSAELRVTYKRSGAEGAPGRGDKPVRPQGEASP
ncbi:MAG: YHYH protein [Verrucomicrobia bacterium]|nr:YHYH protein [Verrucomicrobiota bacterium]